MLASSLVQLLGKGWARRSPPGLLSGTLPFLTSVPLYSRRCLRTRAGALTPEALQLAESDEAPTATRRAPPNALGLEYVLEKVPEAYVEGQQTVRAVWQAATLRDAWRRLYEAYGELSKSDPASAAELRAKDLPALALCTAHAETLHLMALLPPELRVGITSKAVFRFSEVEEFYLHLGQEVEVRGADWVLQLPPPSTADLQYVLRMVGKFGDDGRGCIAHTAHRVSVWRGRQGESLGVTIRVGRFIPNAARALLPLAHKGSVLILSKAGVGKTTLLRDLAAAIAQEPEKPRVTVVDTSNEIGGDGPVPMAFLGRCRRIQVPTRDQQSRAMTEVIQNHSPEFLIVDELATADEAQAAWSIAQRGVRLIATCHGESLAGLLQNQSLNLLVGGAAQAFLSNEERRLRNKTKKTVLERPHASPFRFVVELNARNSGYIYVDVNKAVDLILDDQAAKGQAAIGGPVVLDAPLPMRLEKLIDAQERAARKLERAGAGRSDADSTHDPREDGDDASLSGMFGNPVLDEDGYATVATPRPGATEGRRHRSSRDGEPTNGINGGSHSRRRSRKTDDQLLDELNRFL